MAIRFEGSSEIECGFEHVKHVLENLGERFVGVVGLMPGMSSVDLVEEGTDFVVIRTNEGLMRRTNLSKHIEESRLCVEYNEECQPGSKVTTWAHFVSEFVATVVGSCTVS